MGVLAPPGMGERTAPEIADKPLGTKIGVGLLQDGQCSRAMAHSTAPHSEASRRPEPESVAALVEQAKGGSTNAFEQLVDLYHEEIFRMVFYRTQSRMDAEDLTQDIFFLMIKHIASLQEPLRFRSWLYRIAVNRVRDFHRKKRFLTLFGITGPEPGDGDQGRTEVAEEPRVLDQLIQHEFWAQVTRLSKSLSRLEREVFFLRFTEQFGIKEIAQILGKSESAVKTHLYRALKKFKDNTAFSKLLQGDRA
ncbi:MAG TPA: RNA polymerase sigma factor [Syntrophobacteraceae bacterium]|nr:RNA polymerase sigma factor [Syntrophobacteraceae bacterium]